jgi:cytochrome c peroxidase
MNRLSVLLTMVFSALASFAQAQAPGPNPLAALGTPASPAGNPQTTQKILLGQALFWDEQLSRTGSVACGSCHAPRAGGSDPRVVGGTLGSRHPGADGVAGTDDDAVGAAGVPQHSASGTYLHSNLFGMAPQAGRRQAPTAINAGFPAVLFWDGRANGEFKDPATGAIVSATGAALENQALGPLVNSAEMAHVGGSLADMQARIATARPLRLAENVPGALSAWIAGRGYPALFNEVFGSPTISATAIAQAIASYERSLVANQTPLDAELSGTPSLTALERQGRQVFAQAGCQGCHGGALLSDGAFHYIGVRPQTADDGRFAVTGANADRGRMRTPSLRNVALSAPYMADGRFATLEDVVAFYNRGGDFTANNRDPRIVPLNLTSAQRDALVAFLRRPLTDSRVAAESGPFARPRLFAESTRAPQAVGSGVAGSGGRVPRLVAVEPPFAGASFTVGIDGGLAGAEVRLLLSLQDAGNVNAEALQRSSATLSAQGSVSVTLTLPSDTTLADRELWLRAFVADPAAPGGWAATASARFTVLGLAALQAQTISFANPGTQELGRTPTLTATASSGLNVSFTSGTLPVCTISNSGALSLLTVGTCSITAHQAGNASVAAAPSVTQSFSVMANGSGGSGSSPVLRPDRATVVENSSTVAIDVLGNDRVPDAWLGAAVLSIASGPARGSVSIVTQGTASVLDDRIAYLPNADTSGSDGLRYRLCFGGASPCVDGSLSIEIRPVGGGMLELAVPTNRGHREVTMSGLRALPGVQFAATSLSAGQTLDLPLGWDATPEMPWDNARAGTAHVVGTLAGVSGQALGWQVMAEASGLGGDVDLYIGTDLDGDGQPSENEVGCSAAMSTAGERCELALGVAAGGTGRYWAMLHNRDASAQTGRLSRYEVPLLATDGSLVTTAPGVLAAGESFPLRVQWDDPTLLNGESRVGYVQMRLGGSTQALFPVKLTRNANDSSPLALISGVDRSMRLAGNGSHEQLFIDVPAGATQLVVTTSSTANVDVYLARVAPPVASSAVPSVAMAPARHLAQSSGTTASGNETVTVALPAVGRWYVTPVNTTPAAVTLTVRATVTASAPTVRPGGYYNTGRAGHGVFLYPAGSDWVGLWFTYLPDRTPTWYYLQGPAPGSNGLWRGEVYRATWVGGGRFLTAVGEATATPTAGDAFTFSYTLDGQMGSEAFSSFGRGCPGIGGAAADISQTYYDPARNGSGYSVQVLTSPSPYGFFATFVYDARGVARFLVAEGAPQASTSATLSLDQLTGFCPTCERTAFPSRTPVGTLQRTVSGGRLTGITVNATFTGGVPGGWNAVDTLTMLDEPLRRTQGCQL